MNTTATIFANFKDRLTGHVGSVTISVDFDGVTGDGRLANPLLGSIFSCAAAVMEMDRQAGDRFELMHARISPIRKSTIDTLPTEET